MHVIARDVQTQLAQAAGVRGHHLKQRRMRQRVSRTELHYTQVKPHELTLCLGRCAPKKRARDALLKTDGDDGVTDGEYVTPQSSRVEAVHSQQRANGASS
jgi:hypothetical protein